MSAVLQDPVSQGDAAEALAQQLLAEEEQAKAKAAAKKAKKQKQKANRSQPVSPSPTKSRPSDSSSPADKQEAQPVVPFPPRSGYMDSSPSIDNGGSAALSPSTDAAGRVSVNPGSASSPRTELHRLDINAEASTEEDTFLEQLFCCPLTKVCSCLYIAGAMSALLMCAVQHAHPCLPTANRNGKTHV